MLVKGVEHLGVGMEVLLARIGVGSVEVLGLAVDHPAAAVRRLVLCPLGDGVREVLADDALEGLAVLGPVEMAEHVVQRTVLKQHQDDMVHGVGLGVLGHGNPFSGVKGRGVRRPSEVHCLWLWPATSTLCQDIPSCTIGGGKLSNWAWIASASGNSHRPGSHCRGPSPPSGSVGGRPRG